MIILLASSLVGYFHGEEICEKGLDDVFFKNNDTLLEIIGLTVIGEGIYGLCCIIKRIVKVLIKK